MDLIYYLHQYFVHIPANLTNKASAYTIQPIQNTRYTDDFE